MILIPISDNRRKFLLDEMILTSAFPGIDKLEMFKFGLKEIPSQEQLLHFSLLCHTWVELCLTNTAFFLRFVEVSSLERIAISHETLSELLIRLHSVFSVRGYVSQFLQKKSLIAGEHSSLQYLYIVSTTRIFKSYSKLVVNHIICIADYLAIHISRKLW